MHYQHGPISTVAGYYAKNILWPNSGVGPEDIDATGSYDAFTFTTMLQLEDYGFCKKGEGGQYVSDGTIGLGGKRPNNTSGGHLCEGYTHGMNMVIENVRQLRHDVDDYCPIGAGRQTPAHLRLPRGRLPPGQECRGHRQSRLGQPVDRLVDGHAPRLSAEENRTMPGIQATYLGMPLQLADLDHENLDYFRHCAAHDFHLQACAGCGRLRYPPTTACPWCMTLESTWQQVEGKGAVHSYTEVHHAIQPAFREHTPYMVLLVDLDTQKGEPTPDEALRVVGNLCTPDGQLGAAGHGQAGRHRHARAHGLHRCHRGPRRCRNGRSTRPRRSRQMCGAIRRNSAPINKMGRLFDSRPEKNPRHGGGFQVRA